MRADDGAARKAAPSADTGETLAARLRVVHQRMLEAVLGGGGLGEVAELAAEAADQEAWWWAAWSAALDAIGDGIHVQAVTAWAAFGAVDWDSLLREPALREPAAVRSPRDSQPVIVHKPSRSDRLPTAEQLEQLEQENRARSEKPALLTRNK